MADSPCSARVPRPNALDHQRSDQTESPSCVANAAAVRPLLLHRATVLVHHDLDCRALAIPRLQGASVYRINRGAGQTGTYRWPAQGDRSGFFSSSAVRRRGRLLLRRGHDGSILSRLTGRLAAGEVVGCGRDPSAVVASYLSIDSTRSSGSQGGLQGPRRKWGFETRSETQICYTRCSREPACGFVESFTSTDAFIATNWVLFGYALEQRSARRSMDCVLGGSCPPCGSSHFGRGTCGLGVRR